MTPTSQLDEPQSNYPQIIDGFSYATVFGTRPLNGLSWYQQALGNLEELRLAADSYRPRQWVAPKNFFQYVSGAPVSNILAGKTDFYEFQVKQGSWFWGWQFAVFNDALAQNQFSVVMRQGSEMPFLDRVMLASGIYADAATDPWNTLYPAVNLPMRPRLIVTPTQLHVEISNNSEPGSDEAASCQLLMLFAEPK